MADPITPTDQTGPLDAGHTTSEYAQSKVVVMLASIIAVLGTLTTIVEKVSTIIPESSKGLGLWITVASLAIGGLTSIAYTVQRGLIKVNALRAGVRVAAPSSADDAAANLGK